MHGFLAFEGWRQLFVWRGVGADALVTAAREPPPQDITDQGKILALWKRAGALAVGIDPSNDVLAIEFIGNGWTDLRSLVQDVYVVQGHVLVNRIVENTHNRCGTTRCPCCLPCSHLLADSLIHSLACSSSLTHTLAYLLATLFTLTPAPPRSLTHHSSAHTPRITYGLDASCVHSRGQIHTHVHGHRERR